MHESVVAAEPETLEEGHYHNHHHPNRQHNRLSALDADVAGVGVARGNGASCEAHVSAADDMIDETDARSTANSEKMIIQQTRAWTVQFDSSQAAFQQLKFQFEEQQDDDSEEDRRRLRSRGSSDAKSHPEIISV